MTALLLDPHGDDAALFASFLCLKYKPLVVVTHLSVPVEELAQAMDVLGCKWITYDSLEAIDELSADMVIAPAWEKDGLPEHNEVAERINRTGYQKIRYATYAPRGQRTSTDNEVSAEPWMIARKLRALSCFVSQIEQESTRPWFTSLLDLREWLV